MHTQPEMAAQHRMVDDGKGEVEVKRMLKNYPFFYVGRFFTAVFKK